jgi:hypothetical protein
MESLRTESVGMLSMTLFLLHYSKYHNIKVKTKLKSILMAAAWNPHTYTWIMTNLP